MWVCVGYEVEVLPPLTSPETWRTGVQRRSAKEHTVLGTYPLILNAVRNADWCSPPPPLFPSVLLKSEEKPRKGYDFPRVFLPPRSPAGQAWEFPRGKGDISAPFPKDSCDRRLSEASGSCHSFLSPIPRFAGCMFCRSMTRNFAPVTRDFHYQGPQSAVPPRNILFCEYRQNPILLHTACITLRWADS